MNKLAILAAFCCFPLVGCDRKPEIGRWAVIPVPNSTINDEDTGKLYSYAWRIDTVTGTLEMCYYMANPRGASSGENGDFTSFSCGRAVKAMPTK